LQLRFRHEARLDILEARLWYEERGPGLGVEFSRAVDSSVAGILRFPEAYPEVHRDVRKAVLRRFPYSLLFVIDDTDLLVLGCFHHRRDPKSWLDRR